MTSKPRTPAQAAQQDNRDSLGRYQRKANQAADASIDLDDAGTIQPGPPVKVGTTTAHTIPDEFYGDFWADFDHEAIAEDMRAELNDQIAEHFGDDLCTVEADGTILDRHPTPRDLSEHELRELAGQIDVAELVARHDLSGDDETYAAFVEN